MNRIFVETRELFTPAGGGGWDIRVTTGGGGQENACFYQRMVVILTLSRVVALTEDNSGLANFKSLRSWCTIALDRNLFGTTATRVIRKLCLLKTYRCAWLGWSCYTIFKNWLLTNTICNMGKARSDYDNVVMFSYILPAMLRRSLGRMPDSHGVHFLGYEKIRGREQNAELWKVIAPPCAS